MSVVVGEAAIHQTLFGDYRKITLLHYTTTTYSPVIALHLAMSTWR
jgi:hypothetical protein